MQILSNLAKYLVEGIVVAIVAYYIPKKTNDIRQVIAIGVTAALTFALLDYFSPSIGASSRFGAGFGIGSNVVGFGGNGLLPATGVAGPAVAPAATVGAGPAEGFYEDAVEEDNESSVPSEGEEGFYN